MSVVEGGCRRGAPLDRGERAPADMHNWLRLSRVPIATDGTTAQAALRRRWHAAQGGASGQYSSKYSWIVTGSLVVSSASLSRMRAF